MSARRQREDRKRHGQERGRAATCLQCRKRKQGKERERDGDTDGVGGSDNHGDTPLSEEQN